MRHAPVIGLSAYSEPAQWAVWRAPAVLLPASYVQQVAAAGGIPVLLPPLPGVAAAVSRLDGLILTGGGDIEPGRYGEAPHPRTTRVSEPRDAAELELLDAALGAALPVLGICRGMQLVNVARGGTLCQHLPEEAGHASAPGAYGSHPIRVAPGTRLAEILGEDRHDVPAAHHQAVDALGDGLVATAWAADGVIEAVELPRDGDGGPFVLAVQWHPEASTDRRLVEALVAAAAAGAA
ncbi:MAG: gamma-glutamyl-gamma-aminobutyrate hydrolase family protein, partial [Actinobacteria bacterium]|nr:gamma-glutamyl-gamma-aminobutyrate hydrolase family protein [Actinomycetota bacterium]